MNSLKFGDKVSLQRIEDAGGTLTVFDSIRFEGFEIRRIYFLHEMRDDSVRGRHAHFNLTQFFIAICGSFTVDLIHKGESKQVIADSSKEAIYVPPVTWRVLSGFSPDAVCLVVASETYDEGDYVREFDDFTKIP